MRVYLLTATQLDKIMRWGGGGVSVLKKKDVSDWAKLYAGQNNFPTCTARVPNLCLVNQTGSI